MFDIKEYFNSFEKLSYSLDHSISNIDNDLTYDIDNLLNNRFNKLYLIDRYKYLNNIIEIIYPSLSYPGNYNLIISPDKIRYFLSFYPRKDDFNKINKIVIRPRHIEIDGVELISLYLRRKKIIVLYLSHPHFYKIKSSHYDKYNELLSIDMDKLINNKLFENVIQKNNDSNIYVHPLWYITSIISYKDDDKIEKFFIKNSTNNNKIYEVLNDISYYYSRHGY